MEITGPLNIGVLDNDAGGREIHKLDESDVNRQGMTTILQICEQLQPQIDANELPLEETIVVNIQSHNPFGNIKITNSLVNKNATCRLSNRDLFAAPNANTTMIKLSRCSVIRGLYCRTSS